MRILVATDGSKPALHAVKYAAKLLRLLSSTSNSMTLISLHDDVELRHAKAFVGKEAVADYLRELSEKELKPARKLRDSAGVKHDMEVRTGHVAQEIIRCAMADLLLGSVAQRVLATADLPVART